MAVTDVKVIGDYTAATTIDGSTNYLLIQPGSASTAYRKINRAVFLGVTGQPVDISSVQTLSGKVLDNSNTITVKDTLFTLQDDGDTTKQARFQLSGITTGITRTYTLPNASSTLADISTVQTFTNKTFTSPTINGGTISNSTISVDAIAEFTAGNGVSVDGLNIKDAKLNTNDSVVTANITNAAVTSDKMGLSPGNGSNIIDSGTTTSTSYTSVLTSGGTNPSATVTIGANGLALVTMYALMNQSTSASVMYMTFEANGTNTITGNDNYALTFQAPANNRNIAASATFLLSGLTPGSTTFALNYRVSADTGTYSNRRISVIPL